MGTAGYCKSKQLGLKNQRPASAIESLGVTQTISSV